LRDKAAEGWSEEKERGDVVWGRCQQVAHCGDCPPL